MGGKRIDKNGICCPNCGSNDIISKGTIKLKFSEEVRVLMCKKCGRRFREKYSFDDKSESIKAFKTKGINDSMSDKIDINESENGNEKTINCVTNRIRSLEDILARFNVDRKIWKVDSYKVNTWESGAKVNDEIVVTPLYQIEARLSKIIPDKQLFPVIQTININIKPVNYKNNQKSKYLNTAIIIPDSHNGYIKNMRTNVLNPMHDRKVWDIVIQLIHELDPMKVVLLGDMLDLAEWSDKFIKSPEFYFTTQAALIELNWWMGQIKNNMMNKKSERIYIAGNHEYRLEKSIINNLVASYGLHPVNNNDSHPALSLPNLLNLDKLGFEYIGDYPAGEYWINDNLRCKHGSTASQGAGDTVKNILRETRCSEIVGHIHRQEYAMKTVHIREGQKTYIVMCPGTIARIDGVVPSHNKKENWQQGIAIVYYEDGNGYFNVEPIQIYNKECIYNGKKYIGEDRAVDISEDTNLDFTV